MGLKRQLVEALTAQMAGEKALPPVAGLLIWNAFNQLSRQRTWHATGPNPLSYSEIEAFCRLKCLPLEPRHIDILTALDQAWLAGSLSRLRKDTLPVVNHISKEAITPALWDAIIG